MFVGGRGFFVTGRRLPLRALALAAPLSLLLLLLASELELVWRMRAGRLIPMTSDYLDALGQLCLPLSAAVLTSAALVGLGGYSLKLFRDPRPGGLALVVALDAALRLVLVEAWLGAADEAGSAAALLPGLTYGLLLPSAASLGLLALQSRLGSSRVLAPVLLAATLFLGSSVLWLAPNASAGSGSSPDGSNLLLVTIDTWRYDHLSAHPSAVQQGLTPRIDALAERGWLFTEARSHAPITVPSHASMLSGLAPWEHGVVSNSGVISSEIPWLPDLLTSAGYQTGAVVSGAPIRGSRGFSRGFDSFHDDLRDPAGVDRLVALRLSRLVRGQDDPRTFRSRAARAVTRSQAFLERTRGPWFLWIHLYDVHQPHSVGEEERKPFMESALAGLPDPCLYQDHPASPQGPMGLPVPRLRSVEELCKTGPRLVSRLASYRAEVVHADAAIGRLIDSLDELAWGGAERTAVVVTSDHGESLTEHRSRLTHQFSSYEPVLRVPLVLVPPGGIQGRRSDQLVELRDLPATASALLGLPWAGPGEDWRGVGPDAPAVGSVVRVPPDIGPRSLKPGKALPLLPRFDGSPHRITVRDLENAFIVGGGRADELYDLTSDRSQVQELLDSSTPQEVPPLLRSEAERIGTVLREPRKKAPEVEDDHLEALRALGYVE